jgi:hypothetical protein
MLKIVEDDAEPELTEADRAPLELALQVAREERYPDEHGRAEQIASMLEDRSWFEVASFAAYVVQGCALRLKPWQEPPCCASENNPDERDKAAQVLLRRMLAAGVSRYHPDPLAAIEAAKKQDHER